ncbi:MAG: HPr-rel-A system PqqD family peptide chaperone [Myxococcales bacterium]|nr:HPr-rel-A system PqqD family peptide chaperone [Myxococcales bacterium]
MKNHLHHRPLALAFTALCVVVSLARTAAAQGADPYESALAASAEAEQRGDLVGAARPLEQVLEVYPQDHALRLRLGWVTFRAGRYADAERAYRAALALAPQSIDARLGLAWTLVREGRCDDARAELAPMLEADDAQAEEIAAACVEPASATGRVSLFAAWNQYFFPGHPYKSSGTGVLAGVRGQTAGGLTLQGAFRHMAFTPTAGSGVSAFTQQEVYGLVGYERPAAALFLQGALVFDGSGVIGTSKHVGLAGRWSPAGDLLLDASLSLYDDQTIARIAPSWSIPVGPLRLVPGVAVQVAGGEVKTTGSFTAALDAGPLSLLGRRQIRRRDPPHVPEPARRLRHPRARALGRLGRRARAARLGGLAAGHLRPRSPALDRRHHRERDREQLSRGHARPDLHLLTAPSRAATPQALRTHTPRPLPNSRHPYPRRSTPMSVAALQNLAISDSGFVFDPTSGATFTLNPTGLTVLLALRDGLGLSAIVARLAERFELLAGDTREDILDFVQMLRQHGLLNGDFTLA